MLGDWEQLDPVEIISEYILEQKQSGVVLSTREYNLIIKWLEMCGHNWEALILQLEEHYAKPLQLGKKANLFQIQKSLERSIKQLRMGPKTL